jgi:hypothetical protein
METKTFAVLLFAALWYTVFMKVRTVATAVFLIIFTAAANFYFALRVYPWLAQIYPAIPLTVVMSAQCLLAASGLLHLLPWPKRVRILLTYMGGYWISISTYLLVFTVLCSIAARFVSIPQPAGGAAVLALTAAVSIYGFVNASRIRHPLYELTLSETVHGIKIVLISDLHIGAAKTFERNIERIVQSINDLNPDIVCIPGDIFGDDFATVRDPGRAAAAFRRIRTQYGVYACLGNHDGGRSLDAKVKFLEESHITLLCDDYVIIDGRLALFGRLDPGAADPARGYTRRGDIAGTIRSVGATLPVVVMEHNPARMKEYGSETDLILSGHTHKGQLFPMNLLLSLFFTVHYGHYQKGTGHPHVIVTSGIGTWGAPMRVGSHNEIVSVVLR